MMQNREDLQKCRSIESTCGNATGRVVDNIWSSKVKERTDDDEGNCHGDG